jgi:hypothetical protein
MVVHIHTKYFSQITDHIVYKTLIIIDLDNTLLNYGSRCAIQTDKLIEQAGDLTQLNKLIPKINDLEGFDKLQLLTKWSESKIIFLTSRTRSQQVATRIILFKYKIKYPVLYAGYTSKGEYLIETNMVNLNNFNKIIVVDDLTENLDSVVHTLSKKQITIPVQTFKFANI